MPKVLAMLSDTAGKREKIAEALASIRTKSYEDLTHAELDLLYMNGTAEERQDAAEVEETDAYFDGAFKLVQEGGGGRSPAANLQPSHFLQDAPDFQ